MAMSQSAAIASLSAEMKAAREIIKDRLYFMCLKKAMIPKTNGPQIFFNTDSTLCYEPFSHDFGPLNLSNVYRFCQMVRERLQNPKNDGKVIYYWASPKPNHRANSAVLMGAYEVIYMGRSAEDAYKPLEALEPFLPFRDAAIGPCPFRLTVRHCLRALEKAMKYRFFDFSAFNLEEYEHFEQVENGDCNIILPARFLALAGPLGAKSTDGSPSFTPDDYIPILKKFGVTTVIRLNKKVYDRRKFVDAGIQHYDLYFVDGTCPSLPILDRFINIAETHKGTIGVHCKAGLGRTGTCIAAYIMKHFRFTAAEAIAWLRICRPGSIIGPQQQFLRTQQPRLWKDGKKSRVALAEELKKRDSSTNPSSSSSSSTTSSSSSSSSSSSLSSSVISSSPSTPTETKSVMTSMIASQPNNTSTVHSNANNDMSHTTSSVIAGNGHINPSSSSSSVSSSSSMTSHHHGIAGVHRVSSASSSHSNNNNNNTLSVSHYGHVHGHNHGSHNNSGAHSMPSSPNINRTNGSHTNGFTSLHGNGVTTLGVSPPLIATTAFVSSADRSPIPSSSSSSASHHQTLIGKRDDTLLSMRPIGGHAGANTTTNGNTALIPPSSPSTVGMPSMTSSLLSSSEEKDRDVSSQSRRSTGSSGGVLMNHDDHKNRASRPSDKLLQDNAKLKSGTPLSSVDLKRAIDGHNHTGVYGGHGSGARPASDASYMRRVPLSSPLSSMIGHTNTTTNTINNGNNGPSSSSHPPPMAGATGAHGLAALRKKPVSGVPLASSISSNTGLSRQRASM